MWSLTEKGQHNAWCLQVAAVAVSHAGGVRPEQLDAAKLPTFSRQAGADPLWTPEILQKAKQVC